ncbi:MAG: hypothetical protein AAGJ10_08970 [Bacteroidota bacterium]
MHKLWTYIVGASTSEMVACMRRLVGAEPDDIDLDPTFTFWKWDLSRGQVQINLVPRTDGDMFEVEAERGVVEQRFKKERSLGLAERIVDNCPGTFALVDDDRYCHPVFPQFVRVTRDRLELVMFVDAEDSDEEVIDEAQTILISCRF